MIYQPTTIVKIDYFSYMHGLKELFWIVIIVNINLIELLEDKY